MTQDKKNRKREVHFALPTGIGNVSAEKGWTTTASQREIEAALSILAPS